MEYDLAARVGVKPSRIVFNGPYKRYADIERSMTAGALLNVDTPYQLEMVEEVSRRHPDTPMRLGLRVTFDVGARPSRFGFDADSEEVAEVMTRLRRLPNVDVQGLHCHLSTGLRSTETYRRLTSRMLELSETFFVDAPPKFLDLGGGYFSKMPDRLRAQFGGAVPTFEEYADSIAPQVARRYPGEDGPELILEPGTAITADVVFFAARVLDVRPLGSRRLALVAGSIHNIKPTLNPLNLPVDVVSFEDGRPTTSGEPTDIVGYTCMEHDVLFTGLEQEVAVDDFVVFSNVGSYTTVMKPPFILEDPVMLGWTSDSGYEVLKRQQTGDDVFATYEF